MACPKCGYQKVRALKKQNCINCGNEYEGKNKSKYCSAKCKNIVWYHKNKKLKRSSSG